MRKYLLHILIISFVFLLTPACDVAKTVEEIEIEIEDAKEEVRKNPDDADAHFNLGNAYYKSGRYKEAIESYKQAIKIKPDDARAHYNLGLVYGKLGKYKEAIEPFKQAIRIDPDYVNAHYNLACCYSLLGNVSKALESLGKAIDLYLISNRLNGYDDITHIENDSDLNGLRDEADYKKLINKLKR